MDTILKVNDLHVKNNQVEILRNITFDVKKGEILGIVGESGSGKSTLIRALIQMMEKREEITKGEIYFKNRDLLKMSSKNLRNLRYMYEKGYNKGIDDLTEKISIYGTYDYYGNVVHVLEIADELKKRCAE